MNDIIKLIKDFIWIPILVVIGWLIYMINKDGVFGVIRNFLGGKKSEDNPAFVPSPVGTMPKEQAKVIADRLFIAMDGVGTSEDEIDQCYYAINKYPYGIRDVSFAFGSKKYGLTGSNSWFGSELNLLGWLTKELSKKDLEKWLELYKNAGLS